MRILDRKLWRDMRRMWSQALTVALVVACGVGGFLTSLSAVDSLEAARDQFYARGRFADLFAGVKNAPLSLAARLREAPGVADVQTTVEQMVRVEISDVPEPVIGQLIGIDQLHPHRMNLVTIAKGRPLRSGPARADNDIEALVSEAFAQARGLGPGARLRALINGRQRTLRVVGVALSPEFIFAGLWVCRTRADSVSSGSTATSWLPHTTWKARSTGRHSSSVREPASNRQSPR